MIARALLVAAVAAQRLGELALSRRNRRSLACAGVQAAPDPVYPAMVATHVLLLAGCLLEPWLLARPFVPWIGFPALALFLAAQLLRLGVIRTLGEHWNVRVLESAPRGVVSGGPYRFVRHPNYLAVLVECATLPLVCSAWITWIVVQLVHAPVLARRVRDEERVLLADPAYRAAMEGKPRFVPRLFSSVGR